MNNLPKELLKEYIASQNFTSTADIMTAMKELFKDALQQVMESELDAELGYEKGQRLSNVNEENLSKNCRNGYSKKTVKTQLGEIEVNVPRDRNGNYEPKIISKYNRNADGMEEKILALFRCGMSQRDISEQIKNLYDVEISPELVRKTSEKLMPEIEQWQDRALENIYPFIFMDAINYKAKENNQNVNKEAYVALGVTMQGYKDILGIWISENENSNLGLSVLNDLKRRGINDVFLFCIDGLKGFPEAISEAYPKSQVQRCIIHQILDSTRFVGHKDMKELMSDLKLVYKAVTEEDAVNNLIKFKDKWGEKYPACIKSWEDNWDILSTLFMYPPDIRKIIYTTNITEGLKCQFRKLTKSKPNFQNNDSLKKMLYLAAKKVAERWVQRCRNWDTVLSHLNIIFEDRTV